MISQPCLGDPMRRFVEGVDRSQTTLFPESLEDWVSEDNPVRVIDAFVDALDLRALGFDGVVPEATGRPSYHPAALLKLYIYGYLNRVQSSRRAFRSHEDESVTLIRRKLRQSRREVLQVKLPHLIRQGHLARRIASVR